MPQCTMLRMLGLTLVLAACSKSAKPTAPVCTVQSLALTPAAAEVIVGQTATLVASIAQTGCEGLVITWTTASPNLATVDANGVVTGVAAGGPVTITATTRERSGTATVTVRPVPVASVAVEPATASIDVGTTRQLAASTKGCGRQHPVRPERHVAIREPVHCDGLPDRSRHPRGGRWTGDGHSER